MIDTLERAEQIASNLTQYKRYDKAKQELYRMQDGRASLTLQLLELDHHTISKAIDTADKEADSLYTRLTSLVNGRE